MNGYADYQRFYLEKLLQWSASAFDLSERLEGGPLHISMVSRKAIHTESQHYLTKLRFITVFPNYGLIGGIQ